MNDRVNGIDKSLYDAALAGHLVLSVNDRLARHLAQAYDREQQRQGHSAWLRPDILSFTAWLSRCRSLIPGLPQFLSSVQLLHIWEGIVAEDVRQTGNPLLNIPQTARRAVQAHQLLVGHGVDFDDHYAAADHRAFLRWRRAWQRLAGEKGWHDASEAPWLIADAIAEGAISLPERVVLAGFDDITPDLENLCNVLRTGGVAVETWQPEPFSGPQQYIVDADDPVDEVRRCARWARGVLTGHPEARVAVVAPQLEVYRGLVEQIFTSELEPGALIAGAAEPKAYNLSLGRGLDSEGVVNAALRLLRCGRELEQSELSWLLHTPYLLMAASEESHRAILDYELRNLRRPVWPVTRLPKTLRELAEKKSIPVPFFVRLVERLADEAGHSRKRLPGVWAEHFAGILKQYGWPGERTLSSREYQAVQRLRSCLGELASLDGVGAPLDRAEAIKTLSRIVSNTEFQPEAAEASIQVLGELEAAGMVFDSLWILGMTDTAMPRPANPNPFIPLTLQKRCKMKRADADREYRFATQVAQRLFSAAPEVVASWPKQDKGSPQRPSPFLPAPGEEAPTLPPSCAPDLLFWKARPPLDVLVDAQGPPLSTRKPFTGGTSIIKDQALCPFRAFAHHRLRAVQADSADLGIDNMARGTLVHSVLELFWGEVESHAKLVALDESALARQLDLAVDAALERLERERRNDIPAKQRTIERRRLVALARQWLELERRRAPFRVTAAEKGLHAKVGALTIKTRVDRIDELADGSCAIIDYKTGQPDPLQWLDERITEPQLPIYCLGMGHEKVGAVMFAAVRGKEKECGFRGVARDTEGWPGASSRKLDSTLEDKGWSSFDDISRHWETSLAVLGDAFAGGDARVAPVDQETACKYCDLKTLCRIAEQPPGQGGGEDG